MTANTILIPYQLTGAYIQVLETHHQEVITITTVAILMPLRGKWYCRIYLCLALMIMHATAINWASMTFPLLMFLTFRLHF